MKKNLLFLVAFLCVSVSVLKAQQRTVTGTVISKEDNSPIPGASVTLKGTSNGVATDIDGKYVINVPPEGGILIFSSIGFPDKEAEIGAQAVVDVTLESEAGKLEEVVVTAIGIEREKKAVGYSISTVKARDLVQRSESDPIRAMTGKVPGVNIQGSGGAVGGNTNITIRGNASLTGNVQPLFVVDGVPFDNSVNSTVDASQGGNQTTNRAFDIDPNNIESMTVLKGAAAAALYGSRAANGVIIITTKAGKRSSKKGMEVTYNTSYSMEKVSGLPEYQNTYGSGQFQALTLGFNGSFGPAFTEFDSTPHILDQGLGFLNTSLPQYKGAYEKYQAAPNNVKDFFQTGHLIENSIQFTGGSEKGSFTGGFSRMDNKGIIPNSSISRTSLNIGGATKLDNGLSFNGSLNYVMVNQKTPQVASSLSSNTSVMERLLFVPRQYDLTNLPYEDPITHGNIYNRSDVDNPYWVAKYAPYTSDVSRVFGKAGVSYEFTNWLSASYQIGLNTYTDKRLNVTPKGSYNNPQTGKITSDNWFREEIDGAFLLTFNKDIFKSKIAELNLRAIVGHNANQRTTKRTAVDGNDIIVFGLNNLANTSTQRVVQDIKLQQRFQAVFADVQFSYRDIYFLNFVGRKDYSSTLPANNRTYNYGGVSGSLILTDALKIKSKILDFAKLRAGITRVGNEAQVYKTNQVLNTNVKYGGASVDNSATNNQSGIQFPLVSAGTAYNAMTVSDVNATPNLKPEFVTETELGAELRFLQGRVGFDITYYYKKTTDAIAGINIAPSSGYAFQLKNLGTLVNKGVEIGLDITPVSFENGFKWNIYTSYTHNRNIILDLGEGIDQVVIGGRPDNNILIVQRPGMQFGQIYGTKMLRDPNGNILINASKGAEGRPLIDPNLGIIGNPNPKYILGVTNRFSFKGITLSILIDYKHGGQMWSQTAAEMLGRGVLALDANYNREAASVIPGVLAKADGTILKDESGNVIPNNFPIANYDYWFTQSFGNTNIREVHVFDASVVRLREVSIGYEIPKSLIAKTKVFGSARISLSGRNLWYKAPNFPRAMNFDPETSSLSGSAQGLDFMGVPTTKRYGVNLSVTF